MLATATVVLLLVLLSNEAMSSTLSPLKVSRAFSFTDVVGNSTTLHPSWFKGRSPIECLPYPDYLEVYTAESVTPMSLSDWGRHARAVIDDALPHNGVLILRNLSFITTAADMTEFWSACRDHGTSWESAEYHPFGANREQDDGVDLATQFPGSLVLDCHNEMAYNPLSPGKICLFCMQDAVEGGESLITRNSELTDAISMEVKDFTREHKGVLYVRRYANAESEAPGGNSDSIPFKMPTWQEKTGSEERTGAVQYFVDLGFEKGNIEFDEYGNMTVKFVHKGFIADHVTGQEIWFNIADLGFYPTGDGAFYPKEMITQINSDKWKVTSAVKLQKGDLLVCDNRRVQHGRLPFRDGETKRKMLVVYTKY